MIHAMRIMALTLLISTAAHAQEKPLMEIGTNLGATILSEEGSSFTRGGAPAQGILGQPMIYVSLFAGERIFIEPVIALMFTSGEGYSSSDIGFGMHFGYLFSGASANSAFVAANFASQSTSVEYSREYYDVDNSNSDIGFGGSIGYRLLIGGSVGLRIEGGYRRWSDSELNEYTIGVGIGGIVHRAG